MLGEDAVKKLINDYQFQTVLDIGCGIGAHTEIFRAAGKVITSVDINGKISFCVHDAIIDDYLVLPLGRYDCIWCCHVLEHQLNTNDFLRKLSKDAVDGGIIAITVPPAKQEIVSGHYNLWNAGLLIYNLVMAGIDCSKIQVKSYGYNISVIVRNNKITLPENLPHDVGELEMLKNFLPECVMQNETGEISEYNWEGAI